MTDEALLRLVIEFVQLGTPGEIESMLARHPDLLSERAGELFDGLRRHWAETGKEALVASTSAHRRLLGGRRAAELVERGNELLRTGTAAARDQAIDCYRAAAATAGAEPAGWRAIVNLAHALAERGGPGDRDAAGDLLEPAVRAPDRGVRELAWTHLGHLRLDEYRDSYDTGLLEEAQHAYREALALADVSAVPLREANLASAMLERYRTGGHPEILDEVIAGLERALGPGTGTRLRFPYTVLGEARRLRFETIGGDDLDRAIDCFHHALGESPPGSLDEASALGNLAMALTRRYEVAGAPDDRERADGLFARLLRYEHDLPDDIAAQLMAASAGDVPGPARPDPPESAVNGAIDDAEPLLARLPRAGRGGVLNNLGTALSRRYDATGDLADLEALVHAYERAVAATPPDSPQLAVRLSNLGDALRERAHRLGGEPDLRSALDHLRRALDATEPRAPSRADRAAALATAHLDLYKHTGGRDDREAAARFADEAVRGTAERAPARPGRLNLLASCLQALAPNDIEVADTVVGLMRTAFDATLLDTPVRARHRHNLSQALAERARLTGAAEDRGPALREFERTWREARTTDPATAVSAGRNWGDAAAQWSDWPAAAEGYLRGLAVATALVAAQDRRAHQAAWLRDAQHLPAGAALALTRLNLRQEAVGILDRSRVILSGLQGRP